MDKRKKGENLKLNSIEPLKVKRKRQKFAPDSSRVIIRFFRPGDQNHQKNVINRVCSLSEEKCRQVLKSVRLNFSDRHKNLDDRLIMHYQRIENMIDKPESLSAEHKQLLAFHFTKEYSIESVAFCNPSIVPHPDQDNLPEGAMRVILSFRAIGEEHISSLTFRSGVLDKNNIFIMEPISPFVETSTLEENPTYKKSAFIMILEDVLRHKSLVNNIFDKLPDKFQFDDLKERIQAVLLELDVSDAELEAIDRIYWIARSNFVKCYRSETLLSERVIFPTGQNEIKGIEDARFVRFTDDDGAIRYYATYTAYNGQNILPVMLETRDFLKFKILSIYGKAVKDKGMALFPRKINGKYMMISRQDGENLFIMTSDHLHFWDQMQLLKLPRFPWEFVQIGSCSSPMETEKGWLLLTHGVGAMREYCIGAILLDLNDPTRIIGELEEPLIVPNEYEREGYVPNVVYTCGAIIHNGVLVIPYAISDTSSGIATIQLSDLLDRMNGV
ncbi:MAG: glycoside hydrolase family 130 protein [Desulfobacteraceae bacterium]|nr:glycoside hydrolase family 130 protein [Desulfobacteraceae bacterium]